MSQYSWAGGSGRVDDPFPSPAVQWIVSICEENKKKSSQLKKDVKFSGVVSRYILKRSRFFLAIVNFKQIDSCVSVSNFKVILQMAPFLT